MRKTVIVKESVKQNLEGVPSAEAKKTVIEKLRKLIASHRKDVENSLIATGSPKNIRGLGYKEFNAAVMNRLSEPGKNGDEFRNDITKLIVVFHGNELTADGFFHTSTIGAAGTFGTISTEQMEQWSNLAASQQETGAVTGKTSTPSGDVETKSSQDVGSILSGSAAVLDSVGGIIGLFTGAGQQTSQNNTLNDDYVPSLPEDEPKKFAWGKVIIGLVIIGAIVAAIVYFRKKK